MLLLSSKSYSQEWEEVFFEGFETECEENWDAFATNCFDNWNLVCGSPSIHPNLLQDFEGSQSVFCGSSFSFLFNHVTGENIALDFNFQSGVTYKISYAIATYLPEDLELVNPNLTTGTWILTDGSQVPEEPYSPTSPGGLYHKVPDIPEGSLILDSADFNDSFSTWEENEHIFTPVIDYSNIWFRTDKISPEGGYLALIIDAVKIETCISPVPSFHFENSESEETKEFCLGDDVYLNGFASQYEDSYWIEIIKYPIGSDESVDGENTLWTSNEISTVNLTEIFEVINPNFMFEAGFRYQVKLAVGNDCNSWKEVKHDFEIIDCCDKPVVNFHFEDSDGQETEEFCSGEEIYLNGTASLFENGYWIQLSRKPIGSSESFSGWTTLVLDNTEWNSGEIGLINLSSLFLESAPPYQFESGYVYSIKLALKNKCDGWVSSKMEFSLEDCFDCSEVQDAEDVSFSTEVVQGLDGYNTLIVSDYELYDYLPVANHSWVVYESDNLEGPYQGVAYLSTTGPGPHTLYLEADKNKYYKIVHSVFVKFCGITCYQTTVMGTTVINNTGLACEVVLQLCDIKEPTNLSVDKSGDLTWDRVTDASYYILSSMPLNGKEDDFSCNCSKDSKGFSRIETKENVYRLPKDQQNECFKWYVTAVCKDNSISKSSKPACYGDKRGNRSNDIIPDTSLESSSQEVRELASNTGSGKIDKPNQELNIFPNPASDFITIDLGPRGFKMYDDISIINHTGSIMYWQKIVDDPKCNIDVSQFPKGLYIAILTNQEGTKQMLRFVKQ